MNCDADMANIRQYFEELARGNLAASAVRLDPAAAADFKAAFISFRAALADYTFTLDALIAIRENVVVHWSAHGFDHGAWCAPGDGGWAAQPETVTGVLTYRLLPEPWSALGESPRG